jgi:Ca2+-binding RTX toxin-like protein
MNTRPDQLHDAHVNNSGSATAPPPAAATGGSGVSASKGTDDITGTPDDDVVYAWLYQLDSTDRIALDGGNDTLFIRDKYVHFDTGNYPLFSGIDVLDVTSSGGHASLTITDNFVRQSDSFALTIKYSGGIQHLDTSNVNPDSSLVLLSGHGNVLLSGNNDSVTVANGTSGRVFGLDGNDILHGGDQADFLSGGAGNDLIIAGPGNDILSGGRGADTFNYEGLFDGHDTVIDFESSDAINIGRLLEVNGLAYKSTDTAIKDGNIVLTQNGYNTVIAFDADGSAGHAHTPVAFMTLEHTKVADVHLEQNF